MNIRNVAIGSIITFMMADAIVIGYCIGKLYPFNNQKTPAVQSQQPDAVNANYNANQNQNTVQNDAVNTNKIYQQNEKVVVVYPGMYDEGYLFEIYDDLGEKENLIVVPQSSVPY